MKRFLIATVILWSVLAAPRAQAPESLFISLSADIADALQAAGTGLPRASASRTIVGMRVAQLFQVRQVALNVGGHNWVASVEAVDQNIYGHRAWVGSIDGIANSHVSFVERAGVVSGVINAVGSTFALRTLTPGIYALDQVVERVDDAELFYASDQATRNALDAEPVAVADDDPGFIDVLLLYTAGARDAIGGQAQMDATIAQIMSDSNTIFNRSNITTRLRLVGVQALAYSETTDITTDLAALSANASVSALRDVLGADVVQLLQAGTDPSACGVGFLYQGTTPAEFPAFSISAIDCVSQYTPTHEIGHLMGSHHDPSNAAGTPLFPYSYGYRDAASPNPFRTVMAYNCSPANCPRLASFSNPDVAEQNSGRLTGTATQNNALSINNAARSVANFRPAKQSTPACSYAVSPPWVSLGAAGGPTSITISTQLGCVWSIVSNTEWLAATPASGVGSSTVTITATANSTPTTRNANLVIAGINVSVIQSGPCAYSLSTGAITFDASGGDKSLTLETSPGCPWSAATDATWLAVTPLSGTGSGVITLRAPGNTGRVRAGSLTVAGLTAAVSQISPLPLVGTPTELREVSIIGNRITLAWNGGVGQFDTAGFVVDGGLTPGDVVASVPTGSTAPSVTLDAPTGALYLRVRAVAGIQPNVFSSAPSNDIRVFVNVPGPPSTPANVLSAVNGDRVLLSWTNKGGGGEPTAFQINVGGAVTTSIPVAGPTETFAIADVPPGTYTASVTALNEWGASVASNPVVVFVPAACSDAPQTPTNVQISRIGRVVAIEWEPPATGAAVAAYAVLIGGTVQGSFSTTDRKVSSEVPSGTYSVAISAGNSCGSSSPSTEQLITVP